MQTASRLSKLTRTRNGVARELPGQIVNMDVQPVNNWTFRRLKQVTFTVANYRWSMFSHDLQGHFPRKLKNRSFWQSYQESVRNWRWVRNVTCDWTRASKIGPVADFSGSTVLLFTIFVWIRNPRRWSVGASLSDYELLASPWWRPVRHFLHRRPNGTLGSWNTPPHGLK